MKPDCEAIWIDDPLSELQIMKAIKKISFSKKIAIPTLIFVNNKIAIQLTSNLKYYQMANYFQMKYCKSR